MNQNIAISFSTQDIMRLTMIVTDEDKDEALKFLKELEKKIKTIEQGHCAPKIGRS